MYDPVVKGKRLDFGISGLLYQSTAILYDRETESLWSQIGSEAISGKYLGTRLKKIAARDTTWGAWRAEQPNTLVLSDDTGYGRTYGLQAYAAVRLRGAGAAPTFPVTHRDARLPPQTEVFGLRIGDSTRAYPVPALEASPTVFTDELGGQTLRFTNDPPGEHVTVVDAAGNEIAYQRVYWYAWAAFNPATTVYAAPDSPVAIGETAPPPRETS